MSQPTALTLTDLHERLTTALGALNEHPQDQTQTVDTISVADQDGDEDPAAVAAFLEKYHAALRAVADLDAAYHEIWDCR